MWKRFRGRAREAVFYAQVEAQKFGDGYVSTEHLLLGLVHEPGNGAEKMLNRMGLSRDRVRTEVLGHLPEPMERLGQDMTLTPRGKRVIDLAYDEARHLGDDFIGTEHLLLGLIREERGLAAKILRDLRVDLEMAREALNELKAELDPLM